VDGEARERVVRRVEGGLEPRAASGGQAGQEGQQRHDGAGPRGQEGRREEEDREVRLQGIVARREDLEEVARGAGHADDREETQVDRRLALEQRLGRREHGASRDHGEQEEPRTHGQCCQTGEHRFPVLRAISRQR
jgi:hypothetical protein